MRIVSWNMQGLQIDPDQFRFMLSAIQADVCVFQEVFGSLSFSSTPQTTGITTRRQGQRIDVTAEEQRDFPRLSETWALTHVPCGSNSGAQDRYAYACRQGFSARYTLSVQDPRNDIEDHYARQYLIIKFVRDSSSDGPKLATVHGPYQGDSGAAAEYFDSLKAELSGGYKRSNVTPGSGVPLNCKGGTNATKMVDIIIGDLNVTDVTDLHLNQNATWQCCLNSQTGNGSTGGNLDRVIRRSGRFDNYRCGRIYKTGAKIQPVAGTDRRNRRVVDIQVPADSRYDPFNNSDHFAIYFDPDGTTDPDPSTMEFPDDTGQTVRKPKRRTGEALLELDFKGKARKVEGVSS